MFVVDFYQCLLLRHTLAKSTDNKVGKCRISRKEGLQELQFSVVTIDARTEVTALPGCCLSSNFPEININ